jgi:hypothetical protein
MKPTIKNRLALAATAYDRKQSTRRHYNPYALGQYLMRIEEVIDDIDRGTPIDHALAAGFTGRLLSHLARAAGVAPGAEPGGMVYRPVSRGGE